MIAKITLLLLVSVLTIASTPLTLEVWFPFFEPRQGVNYLEVCSLVATVSGYPAIIYQIKTIKLFWKKKTYRAVFPYITGSFNLIFALNLFVLFFALLYKIIFNGTFTVNGVLVLFVSLSFGIALILEMKKAKELSSKYY